MLLKGHFAEDLILLQSKDSRILASSLNRVCVLIVIDQGNFHKVENGLKFTNSWELANLRKSTKSHLDQLADYICCLTI